jgi:hypothetical protein
MEASKRGIEHDAQDGRPRPSQARFGLILRQFMAIIAGRRLRAARWMQFAYAHPTVEEYVALSMAGRRSCRWGAAL